MAWVKDATGFVGKLGKLRTWDREPQVKVRCEEFLLGLRNLNCLPKHLALLVGGEEGDVRCIATTSDPDDSFNRRMPGRVNQSPSVFEINLEDGVKVGQVEL
jgi:hypothetical protein